MTKITLDDFNLLYNALLLKKASFPVKILRSFKEEIYRYVITNQPTPIMQVAQIDDEYIHDNTLAISIGALNSGEFGLKSIVNSESWYRDIVCDDLKQSGYTSEQILKYCFDDTFKGIQGKLPVWKYLINVSDSYPKVIDRAALNFDDLISKTIKNGRNRVSTYTSVLEIWKCEEPKKACLLIAYLPENRIKVDELELVLKDIFEKDINALKAESDEAPIASDIRRLIRIYDYLKWGKNKSNQNIVPMNRN